MERLLQSTRRHSLWYVVNGLALLLLLWLTWRIINAPLARGPALFTSEDARQIELFSGKAALIFLILSLACTPLASILQWRKAITVRKSLGLWGFAFACVHMLIYIGGTALLSDRQAWQEVSWVLTEGWRADIWLKTPYAQIGYFALALLLPLVLTSNRWAMRILGKSWKRLHRLVYLIVPLVLWHYGWKVIHQEAWGIPSGGENNSGMGQLIVFATIVTLLLLARISNFHKRFTNQNPRSRCSK